MIGNLLAAIGDRRVRVDYEHLQRDRFYSTGRMSDGYYFFVKMIQAEDFTCGVVFIADKGTDPASDEELKMLTTLHVSDTPNHKISDVEMAKNGYTDVLRINLISETKF